MADLSAVLRKTIDGLPNATPQLRAKVYEKARAAIARQIDSANPPLSEDVIEARRSALEDAIDRTEDHYLERDAASTNETARSAATTGAGLPAPTIAATTRPSEGAPASPREDGPTSLPMPPKPSLPNVASGPVAPDTAQKPGWTKALPGASPGPAPAGGANAKKTQGDVSVGDRVAPPVFPVGPGARKGEAAPAPTGRVDPKMDRPEAARGSAASPAQPSWMERRTEPSDGFDQQAIPAADLDAPRYANGRRKARPQRGRAPVLAGLAVIVLAGGATLAYVYQDEVQALLAGSAATTAPASAPSTSDAAATPPAAEAEADVAAVLPPGVAAPATTAPETAAPATPPAAGPVSNRRYTQRLLPDGTEIDEGPGAGNANAFEEGTNIAAASPDTLAAPVVPAPVEEVPPSGTAPATPPAQTPTETAAVQPDTVAGVPAVAQKAVFYEERSETEEGTQRGGNVVWTVVNEPPSEGQPPEPAIRAVADVPEENVRMTMTIRRNADATLPASHVIELMFDVPQNFAGGQIANVQRLALKPTEEARGEPLIGVAGKISDGFFIIALNNLAQATETNLQLLGTEQWIDIPLAYATGRRALISIEKGIPGDRVFKEAMDAWAAKT